MGQTDAFNTDPVPCLQVRQENRIGADLKLLIVPVDIH